MSTSKDGSKLVIKNLDEKRGLWCTPGSGACSTCPDLQWKIFAITGMGFLAASYDLFNILFLTPLMGRRYFQDLPSFMQDNVAPGRLPIAYEAAIIAVLLCGAVIGNVIGGSLADLFGRKLLFEIACCILVVFAFMSAYSFGTSGPAIIGSLAFWRFFLGMGIGAMYPLSAIIMSEYSTRKSRGAFVAIVFSMQGAGILLAAAVAAIANAGIRYYTTSNDFPVGGVYVFGCALGTPYSQCTAAQQTMYEQAVIGSTPDQVEYVWRATVAVGAVPAFIALMLSYFLLVETPRFTAHVEQQYLKTIIDLASQGEPYAAVVANEYITDRSIINADSDLTCCGFLYFHGWNLTAVSVCWFLFNTAFYGLIIASRDAVTVLGFNHVQKYQSSVDETAGLCKAYVALVVASIIPGYYVVVLTSDLIGRKLTQFLGFVLSATFMAALAGSRNVLLQPNNNAQYDNSNGGQSGSGMSLHHMDMSNGWIVLFILTFFFTSFGPLTTTYIIPAEIFPTRFRGTGYGIAAAFGTIGSITGIFGFLYASQPAARQTQYAFPCKGSSIPSDLAADGSCLLLNFCPIGRTVPGGIFSGGSPVGTVCSVCSQLSKSGCADFGLGPDGALGILVTLLIAGAIATLALPLTTQRSLEDINYMNETDAPREFVMFDTFDGEGICGVKADGEDFSYVSSSNQSHVEVTGVNSAHV